MKDVPGDKMVVLGLVTTKTPRRETATELKLRVICETAKEVWG